MTSVRGHDCLCRECPSVGLLNFFPSFELDYKLSNQPAKFLRANFFVAIVSFIAPPILKYTKKDL